MMINLRILDGVSCILMGYGQTGSGKSFTISGLRNNWEHRGLVARLISDMFAEKMHRKKNSKVEYCVSYVELKGREVRDMLTYETDNRVRINERDPFKDISLINVKSEEDALKKIFEGEVRRSSIKGSTYPASHLGTAVITFHVSNTSIVTSWGVDTTAKIHIVEMAGTGTVGKNNCWKRATDIGTANLTMSQLEQFLSYLSGERISANTLIRSSNLLKILGSAFSVSSMMRFISHVRITEEDLNITLSTLRFTTKIARLKPVKVKENVKHRRNVLLHRLQDEVNALKKELMINDLFLHQEALMNISKSRMDQINRSILNFLNGKISDFTLFSVSQAQILLKSIKDLYNRLTVKELEVENLKEKYKSFTGSVTQINTISDLFKEVDLPTDDKRKISNIEEIEKPPKEVDKEVGSLNKFGLTLGPYAEMEEEEEGGKGGKVQKGEKGEKGEEENEEEVWKKEEHDDAGGTLKVRKYLTLNEEIHKVDVSQLRQMFDRFLTEKREYAQIKEQLVKVDKILDAVRDKYINSIDNYFQAKRNLDNLRDKMSKHQQIRYIMEPEVSNNETQEIPELENVLHQDILCYQKVLVNLEENVGQEQDEITKLFDQRVDLCSKLESAFREYCKERDLLFYHTDKPMKLLLKPAEKVSLEVIRQKYTTFQRTMLPKIEDTSSMRKTQFHRNRTCSR